MKKIIAIRNLGRPSRSDFVQDALCRIRHKLSASITKTFFPCFASPIPKLLVVVVLPTPPFWFAIAITLHMVLFLRLVRFFFYIGFLHFHISPVIPVCTLVPVQFGNFRHSHFGLSLQNPLEPLNIILRSHQSNFQHVSSPFLQGFLQ